ncbi:RadC family protein [Serratia fonticola]|uniref:DNA repair protein RadC n=1 Tax=Serratia fonticola TaxID=47917 RepID=A0AAE7EKK3_SERFO|nr:DNA repair protein RadC [Serratia fonticola]QKJ60145.1 DNA repair protein RadC [Serratia fonticola]CAI1541768.1 DNA repair protein RadC [Serratia fonticola]
MRQTQMLLSPPVITANQQQIVSQALAILETQLKHRPYSFTSPEAVKTWLKLHLQPQSRECFMVLFLDNRHRLLASETVSVGTFNATIVYPREIVIRALHHRAAAVVLAHNHPAGDPTPSEADRALTDRLVNALDLVDIRVLDHLIVGDVEPISLAEKGWLPC